MSTIGGPGGIGGPKGPGGPDGPDGPEDLQGPQDVDRAQPTTGQADIDAIAADLAAGKLTAHEAVERMVDQIASGEQLSAADRADLREMLSDLVANDPYLQGLVNRV